MEYLVMECGLSYAVVMDQDGRILKVPNLGYTVGQTLEDVVLLPERPAKTTLHKRLARWGTMVACLCLLLLGSWVWQSPIGTVRMQINPDVLLSVNRFDRVVALEGLNEDGTALIDGYRAYGQEMKTVSDELADRAMELGYLSAGGQITLTVDSEKGDWKTAAEELLLLELEVHFEQRVTVTVDGKRPSAGQEPTEEIIIPSQPEEDPNKDDTDDDFDDERAAFAKDSGTDKTLFSMLKDLRKTIAKKKNLPPFVIFQDPSLEDMAIQYPITIEELTQIVGVGPGKAQKFGQPFLDLIKEYVEENDIMRPIDMIVKSTQKSDLKVSIIHNIDKQIPLEDIAKARNLTFDELLTEIESIVASGIRLDISYDTRDHLDPYVLEEIEDYFRKAESDNVEDAMKALGENEYDEEEVRLVRIKFLSEFGN